MGTARAVSPPALLHESNSGGVVWELVVELAQADDVLLLFLSGTVGDRLYHVRHLCWPSFPRLNFNTRIASVSIFSHDMVGYRRIPSLRLLAARAAH